MSVSGCSVRITDGISSLDLFPFNDIVHAFHQRISQHYDYKEELWLQDSAVYRQKDEVILHVLAKSFDSDTHQRHDA